MFIDTPINPTNRAPEERNVFGDLPDRLCSAPTERGESFVAYVL
jgi:hypothetical protein